MSESIFSRPETLIPLATLGILAVGFFALVGETLKASIKALGK